MEWYRQLRIVLSAKDKLNYLELLIPATPVPAVVGQQVPPETLAAHTAWVNGQKEIVEEGQSVSSYVLKMKGYIDNLEHLGHPVSLSLAVSLILVSLRKEYDSFMQNYNMYRMGKTLNELHAMLKLHEQTLPKRDVHALHAKRAGKIPPPPKKEDPAKDSFCHHYGDTGHWKRNCPQYLFEFLKNKKLPQGASTLDNARYPSRKIQAYIRALATHKDPQGMRLNYALNPRYSQYDRIQAYLDKWTTSILIAIKRIMNPVVAQQISLANALVAPKDQVNIGKCNMRIDPTKTQKESTYQVVLDTLALSPCYNAFLITADVPELYMQQFWFTISKIKDTSYFQITKLD
ncbi:zinc finger, CCHC-type containing protein [Tanacetum coccineum]